MCRRVVAGSFRLEKWLHMPKLWGTWGHGHRRLGCSLRRGQSRGAGLAEEPAPASEQGDQQLGPRPCPLAWYPILAGPASPGVPQMEATHVFLSPRRGLFSAPVLLDAQLRHCSSTELRQRHGQLSPS